MNITNNTILISGGTAGIGFETAKLFAAKGNKIIITGRDQQRLDSALAAIPGAIGILSDVSNKADAESLVARLKKDFSELNMVINNAGRAVAYDLLTASNILEKAQDEMLTNYLSIIRLNELLLPLLASQKTSAIVNVSSVVAIVPASLTTYSASKAALHSYTQSLRFALQHSSVKVFELMPPLVNTEFSKPIGGEKGIEPSLVAQHLAEGIENDNYEIHSGQTQYIYDLYLKSPEEAFNTMQQPR